MNTFKMLCKIFLVTILVCLADGFSVKKIKGMAFSTGHDLWGYRQPFADISLQNLKATGTNFVHISAYAKMNSLNSLNATQVTDDDSIRFIIRKCKAKGFKVFFKPVIEIEGNRWRGFIKGTKHWFEKVYIPFITKMAGIAQKEGVELFAVGSEYAGTLGKRKSWEKVVRRVRGVFKKKITYVGNHDSFERVTFWRQLDFISISAYFKFLPGIRGPSPNLQETKRLWMEKANEINNWRISNGFGSKEVIIAEVGAQSKGNGVVYRVPWDWLVEAPVNFFEQRKMYEGILNAFMPRQWCRGVLLWNWELDPDSGLEYPSSSWYTPQNKPALNVMKKYFK